MFKKYYVFIFIMRQNFEPTIWGPHAWFFLETITMAYSTEPTFQEKKAAEKFFKSLGTMIPCEKCRINYKKHLKKHPLSEEVLSSRDNLFKWIVDVHNSVDPKKQRTYDETFKYYTNKYGYKVTNNNKKNDVNKKIIILFILISVILYILIEIFNILK